MRNPMMRTGFPRNWGRLGNLQPQRYSGLNQTILSTNWNKLAQFGAEGLVRRLKMFLPALNMLDSMTLNQLHPACWNFIMTKLHVYKIEWSGNSLTEQQQSKDAEDQKHFSELCWCCWCKERLTLDSCQLQETPIIFQAHSEAALEIYMQIHIRQCSITSKPKPKMPCFLSPDTCLQNLGISHQAVHCCTFVVSKKAY